MNFYTAFVEYGTDGDATSVFQIEAYDLDVAVAKIKYKIMERHKEDPAYPDYVEDEEYNDTLEYPVPMDGTTNVWATSLVDADDQFFMITIIKTER